MILSFSITMERLLTAIQLLLASVMAFSLSSPLKLVGKEFMNSQRLASLGLFFHLVQKLLLLNNLQ